MQNNELVTDQTRLLAAVNSSSWHRIAIAVVITSLIVGTVGMYLGLITSQHSSQYLGHEVDPLQVIDTNTGQAVRIRDMRKEFERLSREVPRNPEAERAFIESKFEMIRSDPYLSAADKQRAISELQGK